MYIDNEMSESRLAADDAWIDAIPVDPYEACPCGCGRKWKFVKDKAELHEAAFILAYQRKLERGI